jgi:hypothetical protein
VVQHAEAFAMQDHRVWQVLGQGVAGLLVLEDDHDAEQAVMVAAHDGDIVVAQAAGMRTAFVARGDRVPLPDWPTPDLTGAEPIQATATNPA